MCSLYPGARAALLKHVSGNEGGLPPSLIGLRPLFEGLAAAIGVLMKNCCHRTLSFPSFRSFNILLSK